VRRCRDEAGIEPAKCTSEPEVPTDPKPATVPKVATGSGKSRSDGALRFNVGAAADGTSRPRFGR
jgi:hypothetical protein